jgi:hypothetical protein
MKNYSIDKRQVRKAINVNSISAATIDAFIKYLDITEQDTEYDMGKKLTAANTLDARKNYNSRTTNQSNKKGQEDDMGFTRDVNDPQLQNLGG